MDKIGTIVPGSSRKGRVSLSPMLVEYPRGSLWWDVVPEGFRSGCKYSFFWETVPVSNCAEEEQGLLIIHWCCRDVVCQRVFGTSWSWMMFQFQWNWLPFEGHGVKVKVATRSYIWVSYCSWQRRTCRHLSSLFWLIMEELGLLGVQGPHFRKFLGKS